MATTLHLKATGQLLLDLNEQQFADLRRLLVREHGADRDYFIDAPTLGYLEANGCDAALVQALYRALENKRSAYRSPDARAAKPGDPDGGIDVIWREDTDDGDAGDAGPA